MEISVTLMAGTFQDEIGRGVGENHGEALRIGRQRRQSFAGVARGRVTPRRGRNDDRARRGGRRPGGQPNFVTLGKQQHVIVRAADGQPLLETIAAKHARQRLGGQVRRLGIDRPALCPARYGMVDRAEVVLRLLGVRAVVVPVVPDRKRHVVGQVRQPLPRQVSCLASPRRYSSRPTNSPIRPRGSGSVLPFGAYWSIICRSRAYSAAAVSGAVLPIGMHRHGRPVFQQAGLEALFQEREVDCRRGRADVHFARRRPRAGPCRPPGPA